MEMAVPVSLESLCIHTQQRWEPEASCAPVRAGSSRQKRGSRIRNFQTGDMPHVPAFVCNALAGERLRHSHGAGIDGPCQRQYHDDLHARPPTWRAGSTEPAGLRFDKLDPGLIFDCHRLVGLLGSGVQCFLRFDQQDLSALFCDRPMLRAFGNDEELARVE